MSNPATSLPPGFRFYPTDEELILHYLRNRAASDPCPVAIIAEVDIYKFDPWELPAKAMFGDREWYFFSPRDRKYPNGMRPNRSAASGYWKATGTDKPIHAAAAGSNEHVGVKKALVFYKGRPPKGLKTDWIMHEYRLAGDRGGNRYKPMKLTDSSMRLDDWVLCRIYKKGCQPPASPTPATDREQEDSGAEEGYLQSIPQDNHHLKMPRPNSISEFLDDFSELSRLFDNLPEMPAPENGSLLGNPVVPFSSISSSSSNGMNHFARQLSRAESPALIAESYLKRQRAGSGEDDVILHPSKKRSDPFRSFASQFDSPQYNLMNHQCLFNPQLLLNSHLGLQ